MRRVVNIMLAIVLTLAVFLIPDTAIRKAQADNSRDVISATTYVTDDHAHARLFTYNDTAFTNISANNQNISPEVNALAWNDTDEYWAIVARGRMWTYNGTTVAEIVDPDLYDTPAGNIYPYKTVGVSESGGVLAGTLTGRGMSYDGSDAAAYFLANTALTSSIDDSTTTIPVADGSKFQEDNIIAIGMENCLITGITDNDLTVTRGYLDSTAESHGVGETASIAIADIVSVDWDATNNRWVIAALMPDFNTHLFTTSASNASVDLGLTGVSQAKGDYLANDMGYYLVGGMNTAGTASKLFSYDSDATLGDITDQIPNLSQGINAITGGKSEWLVGGKGTSPLYTVDEDDDDFTGTAIDTPDALVEVTAIGYQPDDEADRWLIGGRDADGKALLYLYRSGTFTNLTSQMQSETQAAITTINTIGWNGSYWMIGGAGLFNVSEEVGGSVMSTDEAAKVAFTGETVDHDSSVSVTKVDSVPTGGNVKAAGSVYEFTCQDLVDNELVTQFAKSATINLKYDPATLGNVSENSLSVYYYDEAKKEWIPVSGTINTETNTITAMVNHFTKFGVFSSTGLPYTGK